MSSLVKNQGTGKRLAGNKVKVRVYNGQYNITIPKSFALGFGLKHGSAVELELTQRGILIKRELLSSTSVVLSVVSEKGVFNKNNGGKSESKKPLLTEKEIINGIYYPEEE